MKKLLVFLIATFAYLQYQLWFAEGNWLNVWELQSEVAQQAKSNAELKARNEALVAHVMDLKKGHDAIEEHARHQLGMIKKDETFYHIIEE